jgi:23S rRNA (uracil747-C5)-methyltransferase
MGVGYAVQLADKDASVRAVLREVAPVNAWSEPFTGPEAGFRNKAKLVVGGRRGDPVLGILDADSTVVDLTACGLYEPGLHQTVLALTELVGRTGLRPYDLRRRSGELKHVLVTHSPDKELMLRFVLRSPGQLPRLRESLPDIERTLPGTRVVTANLLPEHKAVLEGDDELVLSEQDTLPMRVDGVVLHLGPRSFFQTNTTVAAGLYRQATEWVADLRPGTLWDLYCGIGGFALHALSAGAADRAVGVEVSPQAVDSARRSAAELGVAGRVEFRADDATALADTSGLPAPDLVVVNPPRRGIGVDLSARLDADGRVQHVVYSSCNARSLAADLAAMPSFTVRRARLFDMFPQTTHHEVLVLLERTRGIR